MNIQKYVDKINIKINILDKFTIDVLTILLILITIILFIKIIVNLSRYSKQKKYDGVCEATFISSSMYGTSKKARKALVRYIVNEKPIIKRMKIAKKYRKGEPLVIKYNKNKITDSILQGDKAKLYKAYRLSLYLVLFVGAIIYYTRYM